MILIHGLCVRHFRAAMLASGFTEDRVQREIERMTEPPCEDAVEGLKARAGILAGVVSGAIKDAMPEDFGTKAKRLEREMEEAMARYRAHVGEHSLNDR